MWFIRRFVVIQVMWIFVSFCKITDQHFSRYWSSLTDNWFHLAIILAMPPLLMVTLNLSLKSPALCLWDETFNIDSLKNLRCYRVGRAVVTAEKVLFFHHPQTASNFHLNLNYFIPTFKVMIWLQNGAKIFVLT